MNRRTFFRAVTLGLFFCFESGWEVFARAEGEFKLATFKADVTPAIGSPLCGGWIRSAEVVDDPLYACGVVLLSEDKPIVLCALDWVETNNESYDAWREALAAAAGTDVNRVAVQCVHPHNAPWANLKANELLATVDPKLRITDAYSFRQAVESTANTLKKSLSAAKPITHVGAGQGRVEKVASTRRVMGDDGRVAIVRMSRAKDMAAKRAPEGTIDPLLKTVSFWNEDEPVAALHYYATHPMSYYGDGRISSDFSGLAREKRQQEQPGIFQVYFNGCAGDITAGKYNDATPESRRALRDRLHAGMVSAWENTQKEAITALDWSMTPVQFSTRSEPEFTSAALKELMNDKQASVSKRSIAAIKLTWLDRLQKPVEVSRLRLGKVQIVHLPGEPFVHYQLFAQQQRSDNFVCVAGYGDGGMGYIPTEKDFEAGGYEPTMCFVGPDCEELLNSAIRVLLK